MKKIIFAALSVLMILSLVGCGEHINYTANKVFSKGDIAGDMNGWSSGAWLSADDDKYEYVYEFTALKDMDSDGDGILKFKVRSTANKWDTGDFGNATLEVDKEVELKSADFGGPEAKMTFEASHKYRITVSSKDGSVFAKLEDLGLDVVPMPFVLNGMAISIDDAAPTLDTALMSFEKDLKGNLTYKVLFVATATEQKFNITDAAGEAIYGSTSSVAVGGDAITLSTAKVADKVPAVKITGLKADGRYAITIVTTPKEVVTASVNLAPVVLKDIKVEATGLPADLNGEELYFTGTFNNWVEPGKDGSIKATVADGKISVTLPEIKIEKPNAEGKFEYALEGKFAAAGWSTPEVCGFDGENAAQNLKVTLAEGDTVVKGVFDNVGDDSKYRCTWSAE